MATIKKDPTGADVNAFLGSVPAERRRAEGHALRALFERVTGEPAAMWGPSIIGFGSHMLVYPSGREVDWPLLAFSPRKANTALYLSVDGYAEYADLMQTLGKHKLGKGCLYIGRLADVDIGVLDELVKNSVTAARALN